MILKWCNMNTDWVLMLPRLVMLKLWILMQCMNVKNAWEETQRPHALTCSMTSAIPMLPITKLHTTSGTMMTTDFTCYEIWQILLITMMVLPLANQMTAATSTRMMSGLTYIGSHPTLVVTLQPGAKFRYPTLKKMTRASAPASPMCSCWVQYMEKLLGV